MWLPKVPRKDLQWRKKQDLSPVSNQFCRGVNLKKTPWRQPGGVCVMVPKPPLRRGFSPAITQRMGQVSPADFQGRWREKCPFRDCVERFDFWRRLIGGCPFAEPRL